MQVSAVTTPATTRGSLAQTVAALSGVITASADGSIDGSTDGSIDGSTAGSTDGTVEDGSPGGLLSLATQPAPARNAITIDLRWYLIRPPGYSIDCPR